MSDEVGVRKPRSIELMGTPLVMFRGAGGVPSVLVDRCPHRNSPLSDGRVRNGGVLECGYHGWRFDGSGGCVDIPGLVGGADVVGERRGVSTHACDERDGVVWFWSEPDVVPTVAPFAMPDLGDGFRQVVLRYDVESTMHAAIENTLDVPHTAFLHRGLLRGGPPNEIRAVRRSIPNGVEVQYFGEPFGIGFIRPPTDTELLHYDRFVLPCVAQVEYWAGPWLQLVNTVLHLPLGPTRTRLWFVLRANSQRLPRRLVELAIRLQGPHVAKQDVRVLERQTANVARFGGERFSSTELDLFGTAVWRLLRAAERGQPTPMVETREVTLRT
jgi:phenylpropionate dioxygenase-like ring-hydroxylating dioxygenase large terminal subunit